ncbi:hypothetical protein ACU769_000343 [Klebsiella variicola]
MTTDIELAQRVERIISDVRLKHGGNDTYAPVMKWDEFLALVKALEKAQRANVAQDDHINQQQDRIDILERRNAELGGELSRYSMSPGQADQRMCESRAARDALGFGKDADDVAPINLRERIDGMKARIAELESQLKAAENNEIDARCHIAELESRTVTINTPDARDEDYDWDGQTPSEAFNTCRMICALMFRQSLRTAGIKVEDE